MRTYNVTIDNKDQGHLSEGFESPPVCGFTTTWQLAHLGRFRVDITVISPEAEKPKRYFPLSDGQAYHILEAIADIIETLNKQARCKDSLRW